MCLKFAIRIEEDGELFYNRAAFLVDDKVVSDLFNELAAEEIRHKMIFENLLSGIKRIDPPESYRGVCRLSSRNIDGKLSFPKKKAEALEINSNSMRPGLCNTEGSGLLSCTIRN